MDVLLHRYLGGAQLAGEEARLLQRGPPSLQSMDLVCPRAAKGLDLSPLGSSNATKNR